MNIAVFGSLTLDLFIRPSQTQVISHVSEYERSDFLAFPHGGKIVADHIEEQFGGGASNISVSLARLGFCPHIFGAIGDDFPAENILKNLSKNGISSENIQQKNKMRSGFSVIINSFDGERTVLFTSGANTAFQTIPKNALQKMDALYLCHLSGVNTDQIFQEISSQIFQKNRPFFAWNPGKESLSLGISQNAKLLSGTNILFLNREEAEVLVQEKAIPNESYGEKVRKGDLKGIKKQKNKLPSYAMRVSHLAKKILESGVETLVITDGQRGSQIFISHQKKYFFCPVEEDAERVDTLGAGDAFASTFTAKKLLGKSLPECAVYATIRATSVVGKVGAQNGLTTTKTLEAQYQKSALKVEEVHF